ncbi:MULTISPECIES: alpha/beta fold hydrolase [unclassified Microbacterium]|uniref:alpha/beta hydrolase family protein n=1 Tax=unclassified Microbacterium TaxID=2609290 RepID=UPI00257D6AF6|nr:MULTISPECIES: alpha/beta fold hydrolase [unclassified Microbacterium]
MQPTSLRRRSRRFPATAVRGAIVVGAVMSVMTLAGCADTPPPEPTPTLSSAPTTPPVDTSSVRTLIDSERSTPDLVVGEPAEPVGGESAVQVSYDSGGANVTGVLRIPDADGPVPIVVVVHGSVDPEDYETGRDLVPEQRALLDAGFAVFATDMRGYAGSDSADTAANLTIDPGFGWSTVLDWGMALDVVNALEIARSGQIDGVDPDAVGLLGHSLGGLLALDAAVISPGASDLVIAMSAPASDLGEALGQVAEDDPDLADELAAEGIGLPAEDPEYWADISPATFFDRATEPLLLLHGSADDVAPAEWAQRTADAWTTAGGTAEVVVLDDGDHHLEPRRGEGDDIIVAAFDAVLR